MQFEIRTPKVGSDYSQWRIVDYSTELARSRRFDDEEKCRHSFARLTEEIRKASDFGALLRTKDFD